MVNPAPTTTTSGGGSTPPQRIPDFSKPRGKIHRGKHNNSAEELMGSRKGKEKELFEVNSAPSRVTEATKEILLVPLSEEGSSSNRTSLGRKESFSGKPSEKKRKWGGLRHYLHRTNQLENNKKDKKNIKDPLVITSAVPRMLFEETDFVEKLKSIHRIFKEKWRDLQSEKANPDIRVERLDQLYELDLSLGRLCNKLDKIIKEEEFIFLSVKEKRKIFDLNDQIACIEPKSPLYIFMCKFFSDNPKEGEIKLKQFISDIAHIVERRQKILNLLNQLHTIYEQDEMDKPICKTPPSKIFESITRNFHVISRDVDKGKSEDIQASFSLIEVIGKNSTDGTVKQCASITPFKMSSIPVSTTMSTVSAPLSASSITEASISRTNREWIELLFREISKRYCGEKKFLNKEIRDKAKFFFDNSKNSAEISLKMPNKKKLTKEQIETLKLQELDKQLSQLNKIIPWYPVMQRLSFIVTFNLSEALPKIWPITLTEILNEVIKQKGNYKLRFGSTHKHDGLKAQIIKHDFFTATVIQYHTFAFFLRPTKKTGMGEEIIHLKLSVEMPHTFTDRYKMIIRCIDLLVLERFPKSFESDFKTIAAIQQEIVSKFNVFQVGKFPLSSGAVVHTGRELEQKLKTVRNK